MVENYLPKSPTSVGWFERTAAMWPPRDQQQHQHPQDRTDARPGLEDGFYLLGTDIKLTCPIFGQESPGRITGNHSESQRTISELPSTNQESLWISINHSRSPLASRITTNHYDTTLLSDISSQRRPRMAATHPRANRAHRRRRGIEAVANHNNVLEPRLHRLQLDVELGLERWLHQG